MAYRIPTCRRCGVEHFNFKPCPEEGRPDRLLDPEVKAEQQRVKGLRQPERIWRNTERMIVPDGRSQASSAFGRMQGGRTPHLGHVNHPGLKDEDRVAVAPPRVVQPGQGLNDVMGSRRAHLGSVTHPLLKEIEAA